VRILAADHENRGGAISFWWMAFTRTTSASTGRAGHRGANRASLRLAAAQGARRAASTRATFYLYNTHDEVDALADGIRQAQKFFGTE